jgi:hypothetical protein
MSKKTIIVTTDTPPMAINRVVRLLKGDDLEGCGAFEFALTGGFVVRTAGE